MRNVRGVFVALYLAAVVGLVVLVMAFVVSIGPRSRERLWRRLSRTGLGIAAIVVVGGAAALVFFDAAFEVFHRLFFPAGTYLFDPRTDRLVQLFPEQFWVETSIGVGVVIALLALGLWRLARRRASRLAR
jgi:integral membrane protein (TIGR01906 family)